MADPNQPAPATETPDDWGYDLLLYGHEQVLRGSDTGVLVAFAAFVFQDVRGAKLPHHTAGLSLLLFSVLMCAIVHFAIGNVYVGRARRLIGRQHENRRHVLVRRMAYTFAVLAGIVQFLLLAAGLFLQLLPEPPEWLRPLVVWLGGGG